MLDYNAFDVLSFDCYGTLIDWETGLQEASKPWRARTGVGASDDALLEAFARHETVVQGAQPEVLYPDILAAVLKAIGQELDAEPTAAECQDFGQSIGDWPPFADASEGLRRLQEKYRLCVLSNVDRASFARSAERLGIRFDYLFTAQDIGSYKPDPRNFQYLVKKLAAAGTPAPRILHVAQSLYHDHAPAQAIGLRSVWIDRRAGRAGGATQNVDAAYDARFTTLADFAAAACG